MQSETQAVTVPQFDSDDNESPLSLGAQISSEGLTHVTIELFTPQTMAKLFTPHTKGMYQQFASDPDCDRLIHGYFRETLPIQILPKGVDQVIADYYRQPHARILRDKLARIRPIKEQIEILERKSSWNNIAWFLLFVLWLILIAKDIAMLIINVKDDCTLNTESGQYGSIDLNTWMVVASMLEIYMISGAMFPYFAKSLRRSSLYKRQRKNVLQNGEWDTQYIMTPSNVRAHASTQWFDNNHLRYLVKISVLYTWLFLIIWTLIGFGLRYHDDGGIDNGPCKDMVEAWIWLQALICIASRFYYCLVYTRLRFCD